MEATISAQAIGNRGTTKIAPEITPSKREQEVLQWAVDAKSEWGTLSGISRGPARAALQANKPDLPGLVREFR